MESCGFGLGAEQGFGTGLMKEIAEEEEEQGGRGGLVDATARA